MRYDLLVPLLLDEVQRLHDRLQGLEARLAGDGSRSAEVAVQTRRP